MTRSLLTKNNANAIFDNIQATNVAGHSIYAVNVAGSQLNPGLQKLVMSCLQEIEDGKLKDTFIEQLSHFDRTPTDRNLKTKLYQAGCTELYYDFAIEAKEGFAKFFEITARHPSGQVILVSAFKHAYSMFREKILPNMAALTFQDQAAIFEVEVVEYLSHNLTSLPEFYGRMEALGLLYFLADNCFIEYANC